MKKRTFNYLFGVTKSEGKHVLLLQRTENGESSVIASIEINPRYELKLQVKADGDKYWFNFSENDGEFINFGGVVSGDILSTNVAGGFTGSLIGLHATTANDTSSR